MFSGWRRPRNHDLVEGRRLRGPEALLRLRRPRCLLRCPGGPPARLRPAPPSRGRCY